MKRKLRLLIYGSCIAAAVQAQPYFFTQSSAAYSSLSGSTSINGSTVWNSFQSFAVPSGFSFGFMGNTYTTIYIEGSGFCRFDANYYYLINPFTVQLRDKGTSTSLSPLSYKLEGTSPNRILKIEWNNCGFVNESSSTANFQLWLYETSHVIETHIGACTVNNPSSAYAGNLYPGPAMGIYEFSSLTFCVYGIGLLGNPAAANDSIIQAANADIFDFSLNGTPAQGNVYRFTPGNLSVGEIDADAGAVFPNPAAVSLCITGFGTEIAYTIRDAAGKAVQSGTAGQHDTVDISLLEDGLYLIEIRTGSALRVRRFVKASG